MPDTTLVGTELDALHLTAKASFRAKNLSAYIGLFAPSLKYKQPDGHVIGRDELARDVESQFQSVDAVDTSYVRESLQLDGDRVKLGVTAPRHITVLREEIFQQVQSANAGAASATARPPLAAIASALQRR